MEEDIAYEGGGKLGDAIKNIKEKVTSKFSKKESPAGKGASGTPGTSAPAPGKGDTGAEPTGAGASPDATGSVSQSSGVGSTVGKGVSSIWSAITEKRGAIWSVFAFFLFLYILFWLFSDNTSSKKKKKSGARGSMYNNQGYEKPWYLRIYESITGFKNPLGVKAYGGVAREELTSGRCDNKEWIPFKSGNNAICINTGFARPRPVRFIIKPENLYEYDQLPYKVKALIRKNANKLYITVPYKYIEQPSSYVLDFTQAKFQDGKSASKLFNTFNYDSWSFKTLTVPQYTNRKRYDSHDKKNYKGLDSFVPIPQKKKSKKSKKQSNGKKFLSKLKKFFGGK
jgi:hypothetical protein